MSLCEPAIFAMTALTACFVLSSCMAAQGTKQWTVSRYEEFQRGTTDGVAIRNDGRIEDGFVASALYKASESYVWSLAKDPNGEIYAGLGGSTGGSAAVVRVSSKSAPVKLFTGRELAVQAVRIAPDHSVFAATSPDGKVYKLGAASGNERVVFDPATTEEKPKYLWDLAVAQDGTLYIATGAPAAVYRVAAKADAKPDLLFRTADAHIRSLLLSNAGVLWAGSDGAGVVYRLDTREAGAKPIAAYAAGHREITAMAMDMSGALYAAAVGAKGPSSLPPLPVTGTVGVTVTFLQPGSTSAAGTNGVVADGSEIVRIAPDGTPQRLISLRDDVVYALSMHQGQVLAATGNHGKIYRLDPTVSGRLTEVARVEAGQATAMVDGDRGLLIGTSNGGQVVRLEQNSAKSTYSSEIFDAGQFARWGRMEVQADHPGFELFARTGNVPSAALGWSNWMLVEAGEETTHLPAGRYAQWRADLHPGSAIDSVTMNYLPRNVAPVVDEIAVVTGARLSSSPSSQQPLTVQVLLPSGASAAQTLSLLQQDVSSAPLTAQKDRNGIVIRWAAHDDNGDELMFEVWYRGVGETTWRLLKDKISDRFFSFDTSLLPDGRYEAKVVASDGPVHTNAESLTGDRTSSLFVVDTTPPAPGPLVARLEQGMVHWTFEARDAVSPIAHAEISIDAGPWQYVEPSGGLSDSLSERYDTRSTLPIKSGFTSDAVEHTLALRVYDRAENMTSVKTVVR